MWPDGRFEIGILYTRVGGFDDGWAWFGDGV